MDELRAEWKHLYAEKLTSMAREKDPIQPSWPVHVDHCFGRIILDNAVGVNRPWMEAVKAPAIKHMSEEQIRAAIKLGEEIVSGKADLEYLNQCSLDLRGKSGPKKKKLESDTAQSSTKSPTETKDDTMKKRKEHPTTGLGKGKKVKQENANISTYFLPSPQSPQQNAQTQLSSTDEKAIQTAQAATQVDMDTQLKRIANSNLTAFRKETLSMLCQVPAGQYSTYQAISDFITKTSHKTCARAVGNAMRNNPFAPEVPCHRILASDGSLGGFAGHWGEDGKFAKEKHKLLHDEGVRFDSNGKVKGPPFRGFRRV